MSGNGAASSGPAAGAGAVEVEVRPGVGMSGNGAASSGPAAGAGAVEVRREQVVLPTYEPCAPEVHPMFIEARVYQGSSGKVYPLPFYDRIETEARERAYDGLWLENEHVRVLVLPQLGGRIHVGQDKSCGYDFFYRQRVIKPALVGLAGPWCSGGVELNWPQHHRPSTYMPCDVHVEREADGGVTVWCSEHEPMGRMKGMHGVRLRPGSSLVELRVRLHNRTPLTQTFLWWANAAVHANEQYQSFFPPDVHYVADHAKRATVEFPVCRGRYYGVDYSPGTDLSWWKHIPVPTSYMACGTDKDFFGGYDHGARAGLVHWAPHQLAPGKKQWTWGAAAFGQAWERNLTDEDGPYIELMAGVFTDNQPDFSFLAPGELKAFSQYWYPLREIGPAQHATLAGALRLTVDGGEATLGVHLTSQHPAARVTLECGPGGSSSGSGSASEDGGQQAQQAQQQLLFEETAALGPGAPLLRRAPLPPGCRPQDLTLRVQAGGQTLLEYRPAPPPAEPPEVPAPATEPPAPADVAGCDELYLIGLHLEQYRHPTRDPCAYWREALARDAGDARCNAALGAWHLRRGEWRAAEAHLRAAVGRLTSRNPNPADGEALYLLGLALRWQGTGRQGEAYEALFKASWNYGWRSAAHYALAQIDAARGDWPAAEQHCRSALATNADHSQARALLAAVLHRAGRRAEAAQLAAGAAAADPLDWGAAHLHGLLGGGEGLRCDTQAALDVAFDYADAGLWEEALDALQPHVDAPQPGTAPVLHYTRAFIRQQLGQDVAECLAAAAAAPSDYCFPSRLWELRVLEWAVAAAPQDARARFYLGCLLYDRRRYGEAVALWEAAVGLDPAGLPSAWRCLGIARFNISGDPEGASAAYQRAMALAPADSRLLYEADQLARRCRLAPAQRLAALEPRMALVQERDALAAEVCDLLNQLGRPEEALELLRGRRWQPWEGGEGAARAQHERAHCALGRSALAEGRPDDATAHFEAALQCPEHLGEARHPLANDAELRLRLGDALAAAGRQEEAEAQWEAAAAQRGDFQSMAVCPFSEATLPSALALRRLGREQEARELLEALQAYAAELAGQEAKVDFFATSLPTMLLFQDDLQARQETKALFLQAQAAWGLGQPERAAEMVADVLQRDPAHGLAADLAAELRAADSCL